MARTREEIREAQLVLRGKLKSAAAKRPRGHQVGAKLSERTKDRIRSGVLVDRLEKIALGKAKLSEPHHVTAALGLLKKVLPDLASVDYTDRADDGPERAALMFDRLAKAMTHIIDVRQAEAIPSALLEQLPADSVKVGR